MSLQGVGIKALSGVDRRNTDGFSIGARSLLYVPKEVKLLHIMKIIHVDANRFAENTMREQISQIVPDAELHCFNHPDTALAFAEAEGCDVLLTDTVFDGFSLDGTMLAEQVQRVNPNVNIIFVTDHADTSAAFSAWQLGASAFLLRPYEKQRLTRAFADPRFASV